MPCKEAALSMQTVHPLGAQPPGHSQICEELQPHEHAMNCRSWSSDLQGWKCWPGTSIEDVTRQPKAPSRAPCHARMPLFLPHGARSASMGKHALAERCALGTAAFLQPRISLMLFSIRTFPRPKLPPSSWPRTQRRKPSKSHRRRHPDEVVRPYVNPLGHASVILIV